jgi:hypothetical protein
VRPGSGDDPGQHGRRNGITRDQQPQQCLLHRRKITESTRSQRANTGVQPLSKWRAVDMRARTRMAGGEQVVKWRWAARRVATTTQAVRVFRPDSASDGKALGCDGAWLACGGGGGGWGALVG